MKKFILLSALFLVSCSHPEKTDEASNFAYAVCLRAGVEDCKDLHDHFLPDDVLARELYGAGQDTPFPSCR